jgi:hypothetical protein
MKPIKKKKLSKKDFDELKKKKQKKVDESQLIKK